MYSLCRDTVTLYRLCGDEVRRWALDNCFLQMGEKLVEDSYSPQLQRNFLLIVPPEQQVLPGDRVIDGPGPQVGLAQWDGFIPANVPGLCLVQYVQRYYVLGSHSHTEAGRNITSAYD